MSDPQTFGLICTSVQPTLLVRLIKIPNVFNPGPATPAGTGGPWPPPTFFS